MIFLIIEAIIVVVNFLILMLSNPIIAYKTKKKTHIAMRFLFIKLF